jgi:hypothetical protein
MEEPPPAVTPAPEGLVDSDRSRFLSVQTAPSTAIHHNGFRHSAGKSFSRAISICFMLDNLSLSLMNAEDR